MQKNLHALELSRLRWTKHKPTSNTVKQKAIKLRLKGLSLRQISKKVGMSHEWVNKVTKAKTTIN